CSRYPGFRPARTSSASDEAVLEGEDYELHAVAQRELREDATDVGLHGRLAEELAFGDLGVAEPAGGKSEDLSLAVGELVPRRRGWTGRLGEVREQLARGRGSDDLGSGVDGADGGEQELRLGVLQQEPARALADRACGR